MRSQSVAEPIVITSRSVNHLPEKDRYEAWRHSSSPRFVPLYETQPIYAFHSTSEIVALRDLTIVYAELSGQHWERDADLLRQAPDESFTVNISQSITAAGVMGGRDFSQGQGCVVLSDLAQASRHQSTSGKSVQLIMPRGAAEAVGIDVARLHGTVLGLSASALLLSYLENLRHALPKLTQDDGDRVARVTSDILGLAINGDGANGAARPEQSSVTLLLARREIHAKLGSPSLTVANLCRQLGVSRSTLHRHFEDVGGVQAYIRNARLDAARSVLLDSRNSERLTELAERFGFADGAHFSRSFRSRFGVSPGDFRAQAREQDRDAD